MTDTAYRDVLLREETAGCLLCWDAPCRRACPHGLAPDDIIRSVRFENEAGAASRLPDPLPCVKCQSRDCLQACLKGKINSPVPIDDIMIRVSGFGRIPATPADLSVDFCGVRFENPFLLSSSVVSSKYEMVARAFEMGWAGAALKTVGMFSSVEVSPRFDALRKKFAPFVGFKNIEQISEYSLEENLAFIRALKKDFPSKVVIASIMGRNEDEWTRLAVLVTEAGADIIECNFSCPHMAEEGLGSDVGQAPELVSAYTKAVRRGTHLPVLAKMTPNISHMEPPAIAAIRAGATGIAAINTIKSVMNVNLETFASGPDVRGQTSVGGYSGKAVKPIALRFIQAMKSAPELFDVPISGMGGIETWRDAVEFMALGCGTVQVTTAVMQYGYRIIEDLIAGLSLYLGSHGYRGVQEIIGRALPNIVPFDNLDRSAICLPRFDLDRCVGCARCYLSCRDGGHQALSRGKRDGKPVLDARRCVGCHLCVLVCPVQAVSPGKRVSRTELDGLWNQKPGNAV